jgi:hypothetical protein
MFHFYLRIPAVRTQDAAPSAETHGGLVPLDCIGARPRALFRMALQHLAFFIARRFPEFEGARLDVELAFQAEEGQPRTPVLTAAHEGRPIARQLVPLEAMDMEPFKSVLLKRHPHIGGEHVEFFLAPAEAKGEAA